AVGVAASTTVAPAIGFPLASFAVTVMVEVPLPAAIGDVAVTVEWVAETARSEERRVGDGGMATPPMVAETVFESAAVDVRLPVATPLASVVGTGCVHVLPAVGVAASTTVAPATGFPFASRAVTVMVEVPPPAAIGDVAVTVERVAETAPAVTTTVAVWVIAPEWVVQGRDCNPCSAAANLSVAPRLRRVGPPARA